MRSIAINVGANTNEPGFRGPVRPDGSFEYVPIPESEPVTEAPTYGDLAPHLDTDIPKELHGTAVHLDPEFPEYPFCERYTYGDEHGVKAGPLSELAAGDYVFFYATLAATGESGAATDWRPPEWGAFLVGQFRLAWDPLTAEDFETATPARREPFANNAHVRRDPIDARVFLLGAPEDSRLYERCVPLSRPSGGVEHNALVARLSDDSGRGPWWRRPLRFDERATPRLLAVVDAVCGAF
jgi:hypothetical protein